MANHLEIYILEKNFVNRSNKPTDIKSITNPSNMSRETKPNQQDTNTSTKKFLDKELRPHTWGEYIGQESIKNNLSVLLEAANKRGHSPEHVLFYGPPGLGKTTLAHLVAHHTGSQIKVTSGPAIEKTADLASLLTNLQSGDILFIDEIHRLNKSIEEILYPAMESGHLDIIIGKGPSARTVQLDIPPFTLIAATTQLALVSAPLRSRFSGGVLKLEFYNQKEMTQIIKNSAERLEIKIEETAAETIAARSRFTPRTANYLLKRSRDLAELAHSDITDATVTKALAMIDIDQLGLNKVDRQLLHTIQKTFNGGPVGIGTLATALSEETATLEEFHEPYLIQIGLLQRTPRGRELTERGRLHVEGENLES